MDEWDEFLSKASEDIIMTASSVEAEDKYMNTAVIQNESAPRVQEDLGGYSDNAEVLMQMSRGESLNQLSSNGIWIKSTINTVKQSNTGASSNVHQPIKRPLKSGVSISVPIANSFQDLSRALTGHPLLSHPLSVLTHSRTFNQVMCPLYEIDSMGLFFYGSAGDSVKVESNVKDDFMKVIELKRILLGKSILNTNLVESSKITNLNDLNDAQMIVSWDNLKVLSNSIPPNGKSSWILPFEVTSSGSINLTFEPIFSPSSLPNTDLFYEFTRKIVESQLASSPGLLEDSEHSIAIEDFKVLVKTKNPAFNISINFRGSCHPDPSNDSLNFLFYRQSNYSVEIDFETLKIASIKSFVPKFDQQNRLFLLLKGLKSKLLTDKLSEGRYYLAHTANCPFIKVLSLNYVEGKEPFLFK